MSSMVVTVASRTARGAAVVLCAGLLSAHPARAAEDGGLEATSSRVVGGVRGSLERLRLATPPSSAFRESQAPTVPTLSISRSGARKLFGGVIGGVLGAILGYQVGSRLEPPCGCDDPGLQWGVYGGAVGLVGGAIGGVALASR